MAKKEPANINLQTIIAIIPYVQLYSSYKIEKFRQFFLLWVVIGVGIGIVSFFIEELIPGISYLVGMPIYAFVIRKWSKEWNEQLSKKTLSKESEDYSSHTPLGN